MWFGTTPDDQLVDPGFPRRFVPRAFDAILRHGAQTLLPDTLHPKSPTRLAMPAELPDELLAMPMTLEEKLDDAVFRPVPTDLGECQVALTETRAALTEMRRQRDSLKAALDNIAHVAAAARTTVPASP